MQVVCQPGGDDGVEVIDMTHVGAEAGPSSSGSKMPSGGGGDGDDPRKNPPWKERALAELL